MKGTYLGCSFSNNEIVEYLDEIKAPYEYLKDEELFNKIAKILNEGKVVGWFNGAMEFGPRALGADQLLEFKKPKNAKYYES